MAREYLTKLPLEEAMEEVRRALVNEGAMIVKKGASRIEAEHGSWFGLTPVTAKKYLVLRFVESEGGTLVKYETTLPTTKIGLALAIVFLIAAIVMHLDVLWAAEHLPPERHIAVLATLIWMTLWLVLGVVFTLWTMWMHSERDKFVRRLLKGYLKR